MATRTLHEMIGRLRRAAGEAAAGGATDAQLLDRFAAQGDQSAFELLLWRHAGAVLGVCRRLLRDERDAEDAFQAAFLVLARKAGSAGRRGSVGGWLYQVARRVALRVRAGAAARAGREGPLGEAEPRAGGPGPAGEAAWAELRGALDEQVERLPARYREAFVLRCLAGKSAEEAARELGCPAATVESRLARARQRLREWLAAKGFGPAALCGAAPASAGSEIGSAALAAAGRAAAGGCVSPRAAALAGEVMRAMTMTKVKAASLLVVLASALAGAGGLACRPAGAEARADDRPAQAPAQKDKADRGKAERERAEKEAASLRAQVEELRRKLNDVQGKAVVADLNVLLLERERKGLREELSRKRQEIDGVLTKVEIARNRLGLTLADTRLALDGVALSRSVKFRLDGKECTINDLKPGMPVSLRIGQEDGKSVATAVEARKPRK